MLTCRNRSRNAFVIALALLAAPAAMGSDFIAFPGVIRHQTIDPTPDVSGGEVRVIPFVDLFYSANYGSEGRLQLLAEAIVTEHTHEMQRLQLGWRVNTNNVLWLGRYHTPVGYWNTEYHHGQYLQTAISRPAAVNFEGRSGILPTHFTGLMLEGHHSLESGRELEYVLTVGETASFHGHRLRPVDVLDPGASENEIGYVFRFALRPEALQENLIGLFIAQNTFHADAATSLHEIDQTAVGIFVNQHWNQSRIIAELLQVRHEFHTGNGNIQGSFPTLYVQGEQKFLDEYTAFARIEKTWNNEDDPLLQQLPAFTMERQAIGVRWDFKEWHALTLELAHGRQQHGSASEVLLQWSAVLP